MARASNANEDFGFMMKRSKNNVKREREGESHVCCAPTYSI